MGSEVFNILVFECRRHERHHVVLACAGAVTSPGSGDGIIKAYIGILEAPETGFGIAT
jgi:hypothetical protein